MPFRWHTSGIEICFDCIEYAFNFDLPEEIADQMSFRDLRNIVADFVAWTNDLYSSAMEHRKGDLNANIVTVLSNEKQIDVNAAGEFARSYLEGKLLDFLRTKAELLGQSDSREERTFGERLRQYIFGMECWYSGVIAWSSQLKRYSSAETS
ncbi:terpenoid synthase [Neolentinus lepideus HHB14362 ss-1]|uniref:Terpene synthase n=1 Tax=Neolentinus lepideus HHB14362 ss-1 TaxID=1314782 RepID=A0A165VQA8_9AGAM|nr:terpenoid synthase [Neolentinus lepideus HHB14362 ss-1]